MWETTAVSLSDDGEYLMVCANRAVTDTEVFIKKIDEDDEFTKIIERDKDARFFGPIIDETAHLMTNYGANNWRMVAVDLNCPEEDNWSEVISERDDVVWSDVKVIGDKLLAVGHTDAVDRMFLYEKGGEEIAEIDLPFGGTISSVSPDKEAGGAYFSLQSFFRPPGIYWLDFEKRSVEPIMQSDEVADPDEFCIRQIFYRSPVDGIAVPMFIMHRSDIDPRQIRPTVLLGYGGYSKPMTPSYTPTAIPWLRSGGIYALANIRGGSEYGESWHREGIRDKRQEAYYDFFAAMQYLIDKGYTDEKHLGVTGRSNGGLLTAAVITQRPDLFKAAACGVPLTDMLRYHRFLIASTWMPEYGNAEEDPEAFEWLYEYSPYHNVEDGTRYPAMYIYAAYDDMRVHPLHACKMAARLQTATASDEPILLHIQSDAGHGIGKPTSQFAEEQACIWSFFFWKLRLRLDDEC